MPASAIMLLRRFANTLLKLAASVSTTEKFGYELRSAISMAVRSQQRRWQCERWRKPFDACRWMYGNVRFNDHALKRKTKQDGIDRSVYDDECIDIK